jgi:hypothetical protein
MMSHLMLQRTGQLSRPLGFMASWNAARGCEEDEEGDEVQGHQQEPWLERSGHRQRSP